MSEYPSYLIHYGTLGQKWGVRRFQNEDGTYTSEGLERRHTKEGYKELKREYKEAVKKADREFVKITKESGKNRIHPYKKAQYDSIDKVDEYAYKKAVELYEKYKDVQLYKAKLKGKDFNESNLKIQQYFEHFTIENEDLFNLSVPSLTYYSVRQGKNGPKVRKSMHI